MFYLQKDLKLMIFYFSLMLALGSKLMSEEKKGRKSPEKNLLSLEKSPYLKQHENNPVWWFPWGDKAFSAAEKQGKPIFLSIGYSTCHWCHVMEGDSFEREEVAHLLNESFISIKVDREERPDVDEIYMTAVQSMTGGGGWPMSIIMTPDRKPFFAATFIERKRFMAILKQTSHLWEHKREDLLSKASQVSKVLMNIANRDQTSLKQEVNDEVFYKFYQDSVNSFDQQKAGFGRAPKFPPSMSIMALFRLYKRSGDKYALNMAVRTLEEMARGGLHDQLGGGFHRYSTDAHWMVPHFEKMLYDNALLTLAYTEGYQITKKNEFQRVVEATTNYVLRDLSHKDGGFYAAEDADSEKAEGKFYVWHWNELKTLLSEKEFLLVEKLYGITKDGNFDTGQFSAIEDAAGLKGVHKANIFYVFKGESLAEINNPEVKALRQKLFLIREKRVRPSLDHQVITGWNGLMIAALAKSYQVFKQEKHLHAAQKAARFIEKNLYQRGELLRRFSKGDSRFRAYLQDYTYFIFGLIELYQTDFNVKWLELALNLQTKQDELFWNEKTGSYFDSDGKDKTLLIRTKDRYDGATPAGNSIAAINLLKLASLSYEESFRNKALQVIKSVSQNLKAHPRAHTMLLHAVDYSLDKSKEIAVIGNCQNSKTKNMLTMLQSPFLPNKVIACGTESKEQTSFQVALLKGKPLIKGEEGGAYVCENKICKLPTLEPKKALELVDSPSTINLALFEKKQKMMK